MAKSLLFIPDISGYTKFIQSTEIEHSQHVIAELLEILIKSNSLEMNLAEVEGDALFFYKEDYMPSQEKLLAQIERMFTAFHGHLKLIEKNRICNCNACATAPQLELKIVAHCGDIQYLNVQGNKKPFGKAVIEAHRLLKNDIKVNNYTLISDALLQDLMMAENYKSKLYDFRPASGIYDNEEIKYSYSAIDNSLLNTLPFETPEPVKLDRAADLTLVVKIGKSAEEIYELVSNYKYRDNWIPGVDEFIYNENEVTRLGTEHMCVINGKHLNFITVTKAVSPGEKVYGELTSSLPIVDKLYQFFIIESKGGQECLLRTELYFESKSNIKMWLFKLLAFKKFKANISNSLENLKAFAEKL